MAKVSDSYESIMILSTKLSEDELKEMVEKFSNLITKNGTLENVDEWGRRKLAYAINYETEGYYVKFEFTSKPEFPAELDRIYNITEGVVRTMTITKE